MRIVTLQAHFDGQQILLDEPYELTPNTKLVINLIETEAADERQDWTRFALANVERAYGENEPEYHSHLIKEANPIMKEGDVVLVSMPQADGRSKSRPAVLLREMRPYRDALMCGVSTQLHQEVKGFDEVISPSDDDFVASGLLAASLIRLGFLTVTPQSEIEGVIGSVAAERHHRLLRTPSEYLIQ